MKKAGREFPVPHYGKAFAENRFWNSVYRKQDGKMHANRDDDEQIGLATEL